MQYPASKGLEYTTQVNRFLDGTEQRYRDSRSPLRRWVVRLNLLDDAELAELEQFFVTNQGAFGGFSFVDPWDEMEYPNCSLDQHSFDVELFGEMRGRTAVVITENRS